MKVHNKISIVMKINIKRFFTIVLGSMIGLLLAAGLCWFGAAIANDGYPQPSEKIWGLSGVPGFLITIFHAVGVIAGGIIGNEVYEE